MGELDSDDINARYIERSHERISFESRGKGFFATLSLDDPAASRKRGASARLAGWRLISRLA